MHQAYTIRGISYFILAQQLSSQLRHDEDWKMMDFAFGDTTWQELKDNKLKDLYYMDIGDGDYQQLTKQFIEPLRWGLEPFAELINKGGVIPKGIAELLLGVEYINGRDIKWSPKMKSFGYWVGRKFVPISVDSFWDYRNDKFDPVKGVASTGGFPIYRGQDEKGFKFE